MLLAKHLPRCACHTPRTPKTSTSTTASDNCVIDGPVATPLGIAVDSAAAALARLTLSSGIFLRDRPTCLGLGVGACARCKFARCALLAT